MTSMSRPQSRKQAKDYLTSENYYQKNSEQGYVYSSSKELLKIVDLTQGQEVNNEIHSNLIDNRNPFNEDKKIVKSRRDNENDRAGFDVTTGAPKSFSLLTEYYRNTNIEKYNQLIEIQKLANQKMMEKLKDYVRARVTINGERKYIKADILYSSFLHDTSRLNKDGTCDMHVHSHNFIYNICSFEDENGKTKVMSLNNEEIMNQKIYLGQTYRNELGKLLKEAGYELELSNAKEGFFEIKGFSREQIEHFSARSLEIQKEMEKMKEEYPLANESKLKDYANNKIKNIKITIDREKLFKENFERMAKVGINEELIKKIESNTPVHFDREEIIEHIKKAYKSITAFQSTFTMENLVKETLKQNVHLGVNEEYLTDLIIEDKEIIKLADNIYSTKEVIDAELYTIKNLQNQSFQIGKNTKAINKEIEKKGYALTDGQKNALETVTQTDKQFIAIQGDAGSGKTFSVKVLSDTYKNKYEFIGLAPTGKAADGLENDSGIKSTTIAKYLIKPIEKTDKQRVIIVDESGMIDSLSMQKLIKSANENGDKVVFIGDTKQLQAVGSGKIFDDMQKYGILKVDVTENRRQKTEKLKETVQLIKDKNIDQAISKLDIQDFSDYENQEIGQNESINALVNDYKKGNLVLAGTNKEKDLLNIKLREKLGQHNQKNAKEILLTNLKNINLSGVDKYHSSTFRPGDIIQKGKSKYIVQSIKNDKTIVVKSARQDKEIIKELDIYSVENEYQLFRENKIKLAPKEQIIFTKNFEDNKKGISFKNGTTATIKKVDEKGNLVVVTEAGRTLKFNIKDAPFIDYGYCLTDYKSQGLSVDTIQVLTSANNNLNAFYVQTTRAKYNATFYTSNKLDFISKIKQEQEKTTTLDYLEYDPITGEVYHIEKEENKNEKILDGWVIRTGGYEALNEHDKESAQASYEVWKENRLSNNQYVYSINEYVNYVQKQNQKKRKKEDEKSIKFKETNSESGDERQAALHESTYRENRERIIAKNRDDMSILSKIPLVFFRKTTKMLLSTNDVNILGERGISRRTNYSMRRANDGDNGITSTRGVNDGTSIKNDINTASAVAGESNQVIKTDGEYNTNIGNSLKSVGRGIRRARELIKRNFIRNFAATSKNRAEVINKLDELKREFKVEKVRDFKEYKTKLNTQNLVNFIASQGKEVTGHNPYFDNKKGEYRVTVNGTRNLNAVDYLIKAHDYSFKEASELLESAYMQQLENKLSERIEVKETKAVKELKTSLMDIINNAKKEDLAFFAYAQGYRENKDKASANWYAMKNPETGDKIIISNKNGTYWYYNPENDNDKGTIYDFYKNRGVTKLSDMVQLVKGADKNIKIGSLSTTSNKDIDIKSLENKYKELKSLFETNNQYLRNRGITEDILKYYSTIKVDEKNNIVTPMYKQERDLKGFENNTNYNPDNLRFSGYNQKLGKPITITKDGKTREKPLKDLNQGYKGLTVLLSDNFQKEDNVSQMNVVVAESFIDALSYMQLKKLNPKNTMLISTNGQQSESMIKSIQSLTSRYPNNKTVLAYDNDKKGDKFAEQTKQFIPNAIREKSKLKDFNEDLKELHKEEVKTLIKKDQEQKQQSKQSQPTQEL